MAGPADEGRRVVASIDKRTRNGRVTYRVRFRTPAGESRNRSFATMKDAKAFAATVETDKLRGSFVDPMRARTTVADLAGEWIATKLDAKPTTVARYRAALDVYVVPRWGSTPIGAVEHAAVQAWAADLARGVGTRNGEPLSGASVRKVVGVLSGVLALGVRDRRLAANPCDGVTLPRVVERPRRYLTGVQVEHLAEAAGDDGRLAVLVLAYCGLRWSELAGLRVGRVDLMRRRLTIAEAMTEVNGARIVWGVPKTYETRTVPVPAFLVDELAAHVAGLAKDDLVFTSPTGAPLRNRNARRGWFDAAATAAGVDGLTPHELRHTAASLAISAGANVKAVQRMLGHATAAMTLDRYADLFDADLDAVADRLDNARRGFVSQACPTAEVVPITAAR